MGSKHDFVGLVEAECDDIAACKSGSVDFFSMHKYSAAVAAVFQNKTRGLGNNGRALAGDARVFQRKVISNVQSAADQKWRGCDSYGAAGLVRRGDRKLRFGQFFHIRHWRFRRALS